MLTATSTTDWHKAETRYIAGDSPGVIARDMGMQPGTLRAYASRHGWPKLRRTAAIVNDTKPARQAEQVAALAVMVQQHGATALQRLGLEMLEELAQDAQSTIARLKQRRPSDTEEEEARERTLKNVVARVKECCGLTDQAAGAGWLVVGRISAAAKAHQDEAQRLPEPLPSPAIIEVSTSTPALSPEVSPAEEPGEPG